MLPWRGRTSLWKDRIAGRFVASYAGYELLHGQRYERPILLHLFRRCIIRRLTGRGKPATDKIQFRHLKQWRIHAGQRSVRAWHRNKRNLGKAPRRRRRKGPDISSLYTTLPSWTNNTFCSVSKTCEQLCPPPLIYTWGIMEGKESSRWRKFFFGHLQPMALEEIL